MIIATHESEWIKEQSVQPLTINLYLPTRREQEIGEWGCRVTIDFQNKLDQIIYGDDSFQSLKLAVRFVRILIDGFIAKGWHVAVRCDNGDIAAVGKADMEKYIDAIF